MKNNIKTNIKAFCSSLFDLYESFKLAKISDSRFKQADMLGWFRQFEERKTFVKTHLGSSVEGRGISLYSIGSGPVKVMLWSQMHGDEPTATMALADVFSFFTNNPDHPAVKTICRKLTLLFIPMLNPDGAEHFTRCNAQMIDINRDAFTLSSPEGKILKSVHEKYRPSFGFNLHDQDTRLTVGSTKKITAVALLAPSGDEARTDTPVRKEAKKIISVLACVLNQFIPGYLAKWDDTFEPRAFGDNFQKWGTSTVLIESGGWHDDPHKFFLRKLNCIGLLVSLHAIATGEYMDADTAESDNIPFNTKFGYDCIIRNARIRINDHSPLSQIDIGINYTTQTDPKSGRTTTLAAIIEVGDLGQYTVLDKEIDAGGTEADQERIKLDLSFPVKEIELLLKRNC